MLSEAMSLVSCLPEEGQDAVGSIVNQRWRIITAYPSLGEALKGVVIDSRQLSVHKFNRRFEGNKR